MGQGTAGNNDFLISGCSELHPAETLASKGFWNSSFEKLVPEGSQRIIFLIFMT
jgi:hypothetical protein